MRIYFRTDVKKCPSCGLPLIAYKTEHRTVRSTSYGEFTAIHHIMHCRNHPGVLYKSERLLSIVSPYCTYSNDVMIDAAVKRFIDGMSCSDISRSTGISESHARNLSNMALDIFSMIHQESAEKLRESMHS